MGRHSHTWLYVSIGLLLCLVIVNAGVAYRSIRQLRDDADQVAHAQEVLRALESTIATINDAETGQRGYLLTTEDFALRPYHEALARIDAELKTLEKLAADNPTLESQLPRLQALVSTKLDELDVTLSMHKDGDADAARQLMLSHLNKRTMHEIRELVDSLESNERRLLGERQLADARAYRAAQAGVLISVAAGVAGLSGLGVLLRRHLAALDAAAGAETRQRQLLRATLASIGDGVIATDLQGRVTFLNSVAEQLTGWPQAEAEGKDLVKVFHIVNEDTRREVDNPSLRALREGKIVGLANHTILIARDGKEWPIDDSAAPITDAEGAISGSVLVFREISHRKQHERAVVEHNQTLQSLNERMNALVWELKASEEQFHTLADSIPQLAWMARPDGHVYWHNKRWYEFTGKQATDTEGWGWQSVVDPEHLPRVLASWKQSLASGTAWEDTFPLKRQDGGIRWYLSRAEPVRNPQGEITAWFGTNTDITERLQLEEALRQADRRKDDFVAMLAHELRNPIAPISNALQIWPMVETDRDEMEKLRGIMMRQVQQLGRLIEDLLDVTRIAPGKLQLRRQPVELASIVAGAIEAMRPFIDACGHRLEVEVASEPLVVDGDVARLTQTLSNLLQNAAKYTPTGGQIRLLAQRRDGQAVIVVEDNGAGIPPQMLGRIFEMFQQVDETLDRSHGGLGIGLTLVKQLVELHGGTVEAHSQGEGKGSQFIVALPIRAAAVPANAEAVRPPLNGHSLRRHRILVVDDVHASAKTLAMMLERLGQDVAIVYDGEAALAHIAANHPDVVFLDIAMPGMSGYQVAEQLRQMQSLDGMTLVAMTGYGHADDRRRALDAGFHQHMTKPTSMDQLIEFLRDAPVAQASTQNAAPLAD